MSMNSMSKTASLFVDLLLHANYNPNKYIQSVMDNAVELTGSKTMLLPTSEIFARVFMEVSAAIEGKVASDSYVSNVPYNVGTREVMDALITKGNRKYNVEFIDPGMHMAGIYTAADYTTLQQYCMHRVLLGKQAGFTKTFLVITGTSLVSEDYRKRLFGEVKHNLEGFYGNRVEVIDATDINQGVLAGTQSASIETVAENLASMYKVCCKLAKAAGITPMVEKDFVVKVARPLAVEVYHAGNVRAEYLDIDRVERIKVTATAKKLHMRTSAFYLALGDIYSKDVEVVNKQLVREAAKVAASVKSIYSKDVNNKDSMYLRRVLTNNFSEATRIAAKYKGENGLTKFVKSKYAKNKLATTHK